MSPAAPHRRRGLRALAAGAVLALVLTGCTGDGQPPGPPEAEGPITVAHTDAVVSEAVAALIERHLRNRGHEVADSDPVSQPWNHTDDTTVAVVDTLAYALQVAPEKVTPEPPAPTPTAAPSASDNASPSEGTTSEGTTSEGTTTGPSPSPDATPSGAGASGTGASAGTPTPTPTPLPHGDSAMGADKVDRLIEEHLAEAAAQRSAAASAEAGEQTPEGGPASPGGSPSGSPSDASAGQEVSDEVTVFAPSAGTLRLTALVTATTAARLGLESVDDLNVLCEPLTASARVDVNSQARPEATRLMRERLDRLAGCRPGQWRPASSAVTGDLVHDRSQLGLAYGIDPAVEDDALVALKDSGRVLPEGRVSVLGQAAHIPRQTREDIRELMGRLDARGLTDLQDLVSGPDALSPEDAAQYWLVDRGLEDAPEDWVVPQNGWF